MMTFTRTSVLNTMAYCLIIFSLPNLYAKTLVAAADPWPPYIDFNNSSGGFSVEIVRAALAEEGFDLIVKNVPWARAVKGVANGHYDILPNAWYTKERNKQFQFSNPYAENNIKLVINKGHTFDYKGLNSLDNLTIGIINGASYGTEFDNSHRFNKSMTSNMLINIRMLINGRIDLTLEDELGLINTIREQAPELLNKINFIEPPFSSNPLYLAVSRHHQRADEIIHAFNNGLNIIKQNGTYDEIRSRYGISHIKN